MRSRSGSIIPPMLVSTVSAALSGQSLEAMSTLGVRPQGLSALGLCRFCGMDLVAGVEHDDPECQRWAFIEADAEYKRREGTAQDARDNYASARNRCSSRTIARLKATLDKAEAALEARTAELSEKFRKGGACVHGRPACEDCIAHDTLLHMSS